MELSDEKATELFTPTKEEQTFNLLKGICPHNGGWTWDGHGHNDDAYKCQLCKEIKWW